MAAVPVLVPRRSARLQYVLDWLLGERLQLSYYITGQETDIPAGSFFIAYGKQAPGALSVPDTGLLWETGIAPQTINEGKWQGLPTFFHTNEDQYTLPFDIFSAVFFLISRYEEYLPFTADKHDRYPATASVLYKADLLQHPIVDEWLQLLRILLRKDLNLPVNDPQFCFIPSYDIDIAWSYRHKGFARNAGGFVTGILQGKIAPAAERVAVLAAGKKDPYDAFDRMEQLHEQYNLRPLWFILAALRTTAFDKNILPQQPHMQGLIRRLNANKSVGMHPSYYATDKAIFSAEKNMLEKITGMTITASRQHYIKLQLPDTYHLLMQHGITADYSMGYGTHLGFRAGTGNDFYWYDLPSETTTALRVYPFCFMDTTAHYDREMSAAEAFTLLWEMMERLKAANSQLITVFHNFSLGTDREWKGWYEGYIGFIEGVLRTES